MTALATVLALLALAAALAALLLGYRLAVAYAALITTLTETDRIEKAQDI